MLRLPASSVARDQWSEEENWFFRLSRYQDRLLKLLDDRPDFVQPDIRRNEIRRVIESGLEDISVSRANLPWGIPWPGDPEHTVYVWLDALTNYLSATGFPDNGYEKTLARGRARDRQGHHALPLHLLAGFPHERGGRAAELGLGARLHQLWRRQALQVGERARRAGRSDSAARSRSAALLPAGGIPWNGDGEFSFERFDERYVADLSNNVGNLLNRVISMIERYRGGTIPSAQAMSMDASIAGALVRYRAAMDENMLHHGAAAAIELASAANVFIEERAPWAQAKDTARAADLDDTLGALVRALIAIATMLHPFVPGRASEMARRLGLSDVVPLEQVVVTNIAGRTVQRGDVLFPKPKDE